MSVSRRDFLMGSVPFAAVALAACQASEDGKKDEATPQAEAGEGASEQPQWPGLGTPIVMNIDRGVYCVSEFGMDCQYIVVGDESALLIDAGTGTCDLDAVVRQVTDKPYKVVLTHGHVDHAGGMGQFDEVWIHPADVERALALTVEDRQTYVDMMLAQSAGLYALTRDDVIDYGKVPELHDVVEGDSFDLGGRTVEVIETPGHTDGSITLLDKESRIMITGDACNSNTLLAVMGGEEFGEHQTISSLLGSAKKLQAIQEEYDRNYNGHVGYAQWIGYLGQQNAEVINSCVRQCEGILDGTIAPEDWEERDGFMGGKVRAVSDGICTIQFLEEQVI